MSVLNARFSLFSAKEKKSERSPDMSGNIEIPAGEVEAFVTWLRSQQPENNWKEEPVIKLRIAGWNAQAKSGADYINGLISDPMAAADKSKSTGGFDF